MGVLGGFFGMLILGVFLNKTHKYRVANIMIGFSTILSLTILLIVLYSEIKILVTIAYIVFGFCCLPSYIISVAYCSEISYRIKESTSTGFFFFAAQIIGIGMSYLAQGIIDWFSGKSGVVIMIIGQVVVTGIGTFAALLMETISYQKVEFVKPMVTSSFLQVRSDEYEYDSS